MRAIALVIGFAAAVALAPARDDPKQAGEFPRRMLFVHVGHYLYLNPLTSGTPARTREALDRFATSLRIPTGKTNNQFFVLSDALPPPEDHVPTKAVIRTAVRRFCETSRAQDRIVVYFSGHLFEKNGSAYLAPVEGDPADLTTLIRVDDVYDLLKGCKATQKVVVWDTCRRNVERAAIRPDSGPTSLELLVALALAPPGVQVVAPCLPSEHGLEYTTPKGDAGLFSGSALLDSLRKSFEDLTVTHKPTPADPIPIVEVFPGVEKYVASAAKAFGVRQTPKLVGKLPAQLTAVDSREALPLPVTFPTAKAALTAEVRAIVQELALPPLVLGEADDPLPLLPFDPATLKPYLPDVSIDDVLRDVEKYPLRAAVLRALQTVRDVMRSGGPKEPRAVTTVSASLGAQIKKTVLEAQAPTAMAIVKLEDELAALLAVEKLRAREPKRWQAHFDYTLAQVRLRLALVNEYNLALGHVRTEALPDLPAGSAGWRLVHSDKMLSRKNVRDLATEARKGLESLATTYKGTPWEVLAKRAMLTPPGLQWEPIKN